jgi:BirA family biotin operon repressor/biotin-[acetyl-CoA-carboxylase] ligase
MTAGRPPVEGAGGVSEIEIIRLLKSATGRYASGQDISKALGISRAAVWKHMESLRRAGYAIEASPSKGYHLDASVASLPYNGIEISMGLATDIIGSRVAFYPSVVSTNAAAIELARAREPEGTVVVADAQTGGRGRMGRTWLSPPGVNVYTSIILRPDITPRAAHELTFVMAVAVAEATAGFSRTTPAVKWPNDVLIARRKVAGILMEMESEAERVKFIVAGVGVNINMPEDLFPAELRGSAVSLKAHAGGEVSRTDYLRALYSSVEKWYKLYVDKGFVPVAAEWKRYFTSEGKPVRVDMFGRVLEGVCMGIDSDGSLLVRTPGGVVERVVSGDMEAKG